MFSKKSIFNTLSFFILIFFNLNHSFAASISDIEIVVKETVITAEGFNPISGVPLNFGHIGSLKFVLNDEPHKCLAKVSGVVYEFETIQSQEVMDFLVCVKTDLDGSLLGSILSLTYVPHR